ncbi:MAG TPA: helix-turn-helix domain-containing protein [Coleofasciculaceae cyanobacterium]
MGITTAEQFGALIRKTRKAQKVTQKELAAASGTGVRFIRELEKGKASCELGKSLLVASMLGLRLGMAGGELAE